MNTLTQLPITRRWPPVNPQVIQLYSYPTPSGVKVSTMLEETGLEYEPHLVDFGQNDQISEEYLSAFPNNKIPGIVDPNGPGGKPLAIFESGAILLYLAEKSGMFMPEGKRWEVMQWLMWQMSGQGPMFGQLGYFYHYHGKDIADPRPKERFINEARRLLRVLDKQLDGRDWVVGEYSIADIAIAPWLHGLIEYYKAGEVTGWNELKNVPAYFDRFLARPAVQRALNIPAVPK